MRKRGRGEMRKKGRGEMRKKGRGEIGKRGGGEIGKRGGGDREEGGGGEIGRCHILVYSVCGTYSVVYSRYDVHAVREQCVVYKQFLTERHNVHVQHAR